MNSSSTVPLFQSEWMTSRYELPALLFGTAISKCNLPLVSIAEVAKNEKTYCCTYVFTFFKCKLSRKATMAGLKRLSTLRTYQWNKR